MSRGKSDNAKTGGGCLCGAVRYEIAGALPPPSACHCVQCRRHQGALGVYTLAPEERYTIKGKRNLAWYESSPGIRRGFCRNCGSKLFWQRSGSDQLDVTLGSMDEPTGLKIEKHIYLADAGDYYDPTQPMNFASLPMYNPAEDPGVSAALWRGIAHHLIRAGIADVPDRLLERPPIPDHWLSDDLLFSQTCGYPLTHALKDRVQLLATPCYEAEGCEGASYCSFVIVAAESPATSLTDLRGKRVAFNTPDSQSGMNALRALVAPIAERKKFFGEVIETGSHSASLAHVASGKADVAAIDCVSFALFSGHARADTRRVRILCRTASAPNLPFITAGSTAPERVQRLREGLRAAMADRALAGARQALLLKDIMLLPESAYQPLLDMERDAERLGYPRLG